MKADVVKLGIVDPQRAIMLKLRDDTISSQVPQVYEMNKLRGVQLIHHQH